MASNSGCVGLAVADSAELSQLVRRLVPEADVLGETADLVVRRWQDPSGCRLVVGMRGTEIVDLLPSFAASTGAVLGPLTFLPNGLSSAAVLDEHGDQVTAMAFVLEERRLMEALAGPIEGPAAITALGVDVEVFASAALFSESDASLFTPRDEPAGDPPAAFVERGWSWPPRVGSESFFSHGVSGSAESTTAHARLTGTVLDARQHTAELTGQPFIEARVRTAGFEAHVCYPAGELTLPEAGNVIAGTVFIVASMDLN